MSLASRMLVLGTILVTVGCDSSPVAPRSYGEGDVRVTVTAPNLAITSARDVVFAEIGAASTRHLVRERAQDAKYQRDIVRSEAPQSVLFDPDASEIEAMGVQVADLTERP